MQHEPDTVDQTTEAGAKAVKSVTLALQGGGAHGAFAWGVLDRLLEDERLRIEAISATSAGAMNAVVMAYGYSRGNIRGARDKLEEFWREVATSGSIWNPARAFPWDSWMRAAGLSADLTPSFLAFQAMTHVFSPYDFNPANFNPLRDLLCRVVDFKHLAACPITTRLYLSATNVRTGKIKVFENKDLSVDVVMASACLPFLFQTVEIDGEAYWDGGFMGNPAIFPLIYRRGSRDVIITHINPITRRDIPRTAPEIFDRMNEIAFNSSLMREMRAIAFVTRLIDEGALDAARYSRILIHSIRDDDRMSALGAASKFDTDWAFLSELRHAGRACADRWLAQNFEQIGRTSTVALREVFL